jgi:CheY-like chemotaxis protein
MQQAVMNLAINARDAMPDGGSLYVGLERIRIESLDESPLPELGTGEWVCVTVSDTGTGISPQDLPYIFEPFFTTKELGQGTGLGLAQVHGIVGAHEGAIGVESRVDEGTTFTIFLPVFSTRPADALPSDLEPLAVGQGKTILVVEDNAVARRALVESMELLNYRVLEASNGQEALALLTRHGTEIALVLSDVVMPGMGGVALLHALREMELDVGVVMLTGHPLEGEMEALRAQGMIDWLHKPPSLEQLAKVVARALAKDE